MGRFFTSTQIYNPKQLDRDGFKAYFCERMKKEDYEICDVDCAELSYVLVFADNRKWVTLSSEAYEQGNRTSQADTARIAKMLGTYCVNTIVIDSDCAMLDIYDDKGKKADTAVMGRADDYLGDDIPVPLKTVWEQFISADSTWEQFVSVVQGDYVFVEDGLSELAPVIGMDSDNILFEYEDADENNENICFLSFRKAGSKKEKKLTLNAAFKQVFGETLEPLGFIKVKSNYPYYARLINQEIVHVISFIPEKSGGLNCFRVLCGVATVFRKNIDLHTNPKNNLGWLKDLTSFYLIYCTDENIRNESIKFTYKNNDDISLENALRCSCDLVNRYIIPSLNGINTIDSCIDFYTVFQLPLHLFDELENFGNDNPNNDYNEGLIFIKKGDQKSILDKYNERLKSIRRNIQLGRFYTSKDYDNKLKKYNLINQCSHFTPELFIAVEEELKRRKKHNITKLKSYGLL